MTIKAQTQFKNNNTKGTLVANRESLLDKAPYSVKKLPLSPYKTSHLRWEIAGLSFSLVFTYHTLTRNLT